MTPFAVWIVWFALTSQSVCGGISGIGPLSSRQYSALRRGNEPFNFRGTERNSNGKLVRAAGIEPARGYPQRIFLPATVFTAAPSGVCGLDYTFTLAPSRLRCCPSSLYTFPWAPTCPWAWLGIAILQGSPSLSSSASRVSLRALKSFKSVASTDSATPALDLL